ncbi:hypothetical protein K432DRAFT_266849, partial [Lepidopterella palustris CBS 459.81]
VIWIPDFTICAHDVETTFASLTTAKRLQFLSMGLSDSRPYISRFDAFMPNKFRVTKSGDGQSMYVLYSRSNHSCDPNA